MRVYVGERDPASGQCRVWLVHEPPRPSLVEVVELIADLRRLSAPPPPDLALGDRARGGDDPSAAGESEHAGSSGEAELRRADVLARKEALVAQLEAAERAPAAAELLAGGNGSCGFGWGGDPRGSALALAILRSELGEDPPGAVYEKFRREVVDLVHDRWSLRLPADDVWGWIEANRRLVEYELFEKPRVPTLPEEGEGPSLAVSTTTETPPGVDAVVEEPISDAAASRVVQACEEAWADIRRHHPELPHAVMILGTGVERGRLVKLGHWWSGRWVADGEVLGEVLLAGEALCLKPEEVFEVLLHEAAHGLNAARGIKDTSREGRYHNARFAAAAREVGLKVAAAPPHGLARTSVTPEARDRYGASIERLGEVMCIARQIESNVRAGSVEDERGKGGAEPGDEEGSRSKGRALAVCGCGRKLRVAPTVLAAGPIVCGLCEVEFTSGADRSASRPPERALEGRDAGVVDRTFMGRRRAEIGVPEAAAPAASPDSSLLPGEASADGSSPREPAAAGVPRSWTADDLVAAGAWYERFGKFNEEPMTARNEAEARRRTDLARALLRADGTLRGPAVELGGREMAAGDRVVVVADDKEMELPGGTLGTVEAVDPAAEEFEIDFATWGRLRAGVEDAVARLLRHDYVTADGGAAADRGTDRGVEVGAERSEGADA